MWWLSLLCFLVGTSHEAGPTLRPLTVCEVLRDLSSYSGKIIAVRGRWVASDEGRWLSGERCPARLTTEGFVWPDLIYLEESGAVFERNLAAFLEGGAGASAEKVALEMADQTSRAVCVTVIGRLMTRSKLEVVPGGDGKLRGYGFGHLNAAPAQLLYQVRRDLALCK
jgi:hypothetical protein